MANFKFFCAHCGQKLEADDSLSGQNLECPICKNTITIPDNNTKQNSMKQIELDTEKLENKTTNEFDPVDSIIAPFIHDDDDETIIQALKIIAQENKVSTSFLQRRLTIGYCSAAKIIDELEARGAISAPHPGDSKRDVLISKTPNNSSKRKKNIQKKSNQSNDITASISWHKINASDFDNPHKKKNIIEILSDVIGFSLLWAWKLKYVLMILFTLWVLWDMNNSPSSAAHKELLKMKEKYGEEYDAKREARDAVKKILKCPSTVRFQNDEIVERCDSYAINFGTKNNIDSEMIWHVVGSFDAQNSFGAMVRNRYSVLLLYLGSRTYRVIDIQAN